MDSSASESDSTTPKKRYKCTIKGCNAAFSKNNKLTYHIRKHKNERPFACDVPGCDKTYTNSSHLRRHKNVTHHEEKQSTGILCDYEGCGMVLANNWSMKKHQSRKHNPEAYAFRCNDCTQGFHKKRQLVQHTYLHTGVAPFSCDKCDMNFTSIINMNKHKRSHRTYSCDCGKIFHRWSLILAHKKRCKKSRHECDQCDKTFTQKSNLKNHKLTHLEISQKLVYVCPYPKCKRYYFFKKNIKYHIDYFHKKINEGKTYKCTYPKCTVLLRSQQSLRMHLQRHFKWVPKKQRKPRRDKGIPKKPMISMLCAESDEEQNDGDAKIVEPKKQISRNRREMTDDDILRQCDVVLSKLNEKMITAN